MKSDDEDYERLVRAGMDLARHLNAKGVSPKVARKLIVEFVNDQISAPKQDDSSSLTLTN